MRGRRQYIFYVQTCCQCRAYKLLRMPKCCWLYFFAFTLGVLYSFCSLFLRFTFLRCELQKIHSIYAVAEKSRLEDVFFVGNQNHDALSGCYLTAVTFCDAATCPCEAYVSCECMYERLSVPPVIKK